MPDLSDRLVACTLPGSAWLGVFTSHITWAIEADAIEIEPGDAARVARQLVMLYVAAREGAPPSMDDVVTEMRELLEAACTKLGYVPTPEDYLLADRYVVRHEDMCGLIRKLVAARA